MNMQKNAKSTRIPNPKNHIIIPIRQDLLWSVYGFYLGYFLSSIPPNGQGPDGITKFSTTRTEYRDIWDTC